MAIHFPNEEPTYTQRTTVAFPALLNGVSVSCEISTEALMDHFGAKTINKADLIAAFKSNRSAIENAVRNKLPITSSDRCLIVSADFS
jgi:hypothetical protein